MSNHPDISGISKLFPKILHLWKDVPTHHGWAMEKLMELFNTHIAPKPHLVQSVGFETFVNGFFDSGKLLSYPDFVLNNVALMAGETLVMGAAELQCLEEPALKLIRHPLQHWLVNKGHSADVTFRVYTKLVANRILLNRLDEFLFDIPQAMAYSIASPHNYTRRSSGTYFMEAVKFAYDNTNSSGMCLHKNQVEEIENIKVKLRSTLIDQVKMFIKNLTENVTDTISNGSGDGGRDCLSRAGLDEKLRFYQLLLESSRSCHGWFSTLKSCDILDDILSQSLTVDFRRHPDALELFVICADQILQVLEARESNQESYFKKLLQVVTSLLQTHSSVAVVEAMSLAHGFLSRVKKAKREEMDLMLEISILPLFELVKSTPHCLLQTCPEALRNLQQMQHIKEQSTSLLKEAVKNMYSISAHKNNLNKQHLGLLNYFCLRECQTPEEVGAPLLTEGCVRDENVAQFLEYSFTYITKSCAGNNLSLKYLQDIIQAVVIYSELPVSRIESAVNCYIHFMETSSDADTLHHILRVLQLKMVDIDPHMQETAVKMAGKLLMCDGINLSSDEVERCISSVWQCANYTVEEVVCQVLEFLAQASSAGKLSDILCRINVEKGVVETMSEKFLLTRGLDNVKPYAFRLLSLMSAREMMLTYSHTSLKYGCAALHSAVLSYVRSLFDQSRDPGNSLEVNVMSTMSLLEEGWADLLLDKANNVETCNLRCTSQMLKDLYNYMVQKDVSDYVDTLASQSAAIPDEVNTNLMKSLCENIMFVYGYNVKDCDDVSVSKALKDVECNGDDYQSKAKKCKVSDTDKKCSEGDNFVCSMLSGKTITNNDALQMIKDHKSGFDRGEKEQAVDSTQEMPPLVLYTQPSILQLLVSTYMSTEPINQPKQNVSLATWFIIKEIMLQIDLESLNSEAQRSTDEYEKNGAMLLHDFEQLLNKCYVTLQEDLEVDIMAGFLKKLLDLLSIDANEKKKKDVRVSHLKNTISCWRHLAIMTSDITLFIDFVLDNRKSYISVSEPPVATPFVLDTFHDRLNSSNSHGSQAAYGKDSSPTNMDTFLQIYSEDRMSILKTKTECPITPDVIISDLKRNCNYLDETKISVLDNLSASDCESLYNLLQTGTGRGSKGPADTVKLLVDQDRKTAFNEVLRFVNILLREIVLLFFDGDTRANMKQTERVTDLVGYVEQLHHWLFAEDEFDFDVGNDPASLDCF